MRDMEAVASIVAGDPDGLATAYDRYADPLFTYCRSLLGDAAEAADVVQDTFVVAAARLSGLDDPQRLRAWLFAVARGECLRVLRSKTRTQPPPEAPVTGGADGTVPTSETGRAGGTGLPGGTDSTGVADTAGSESEQAGRAGLRMLFEDASAGLGPAEREVIELRLRQGLKPGDVAAVLGVSRSRAHALASRASDQLETCLGVLLVGRAGRAECAELGAMLSGWDGRLTATLSKRVGRHIEHCAACSARRAIELRPSRLLELTPAAALAAGAAESFRRAPGAPAALKAHTIALATEHGSVRAAHATAVLSRSGTFGKQGFPRQPRGTLGTGGGGSRRSVRSSPQRQVAVAAAVVLAAGVAAAFALSGGQEHRTPVAGSKTPVSSADQGAATTSAAAARSIGPAASGGSHAARATTPTPASATRATSTTPAPVPTTTAPSVTTSTAAKSPSPTASQPAGTLQVFPGGGSLFLVPGGRGAPLFLSASGGTVNWSVSVSGDPDHTITVSPAASGTLTAAHPHVTLEITASQDLSCGDGGNPCPTITIEPGGTVLTLTTSGHRRHDGTPTA